MYSSGGETTIGTAEARNLRPVWEVTATAVDAGGTFTATPVIAGGCLYIGVTGLTPEERFARHRAGTQAARLVHAHGVRLRLDLVEGFSRLPYRIAA